MMKSVYTAPPPIRKATRDVVMSFINALNAENFSEARALVGDDMQFRGVMGTRDGANAYFSNMRKMKLKYKVKQSFVEGDEVCLLYNIAMDGKNIFSAGWYKVAEGKIQNIRVVFDPRPLLQNISPQ